MLILDRAKRMRRVSPTAMCYFTTPDQVTRAHRHSRTSSIPPQIPLLTPNSPPTDMPFEPMSSLDFGQYIDSTPIAIHPHLPLETVMEMFKKLGPRVILVELRGRVAGLVTVKDVLKYQFKVENEENPRVERTDGGMEERIWGAIERLGTAVSGMWERVVRGKKRPGSSEGIRNVVQEDELELVDHPR